MMQFSQKVEKTEFYRNIELTRAGAVRAVTFLIVPLAVPESINDLGERS